jgi:hypothetical protein
VEELEKLSKLKSVSSTNIHKVSVNYMGSTYSRGQNKNRVRGNITQKRSGHAYSNSRSDDSQAGTSDQQSGNGNPSGYKAPYGNGNYKGNFPQRGRGNFLSSKGVTFRYCLKLNHFVRYLRERIAKEHSVPAVDIETGLYNDDYFFASTNQS